MFPIRSTRKEKPFFSLDFSMENSVKDQSSASENVRRSTTKLLRYPLRSATKAKEEKPPLADSSNSSVSRSRGRIASSVSKSVSVLDLSGKEKSVKPPRRQSIPTKSTASPVRKSVGNITPISEARATKATSDLGRSDTPRSDVSKSSLRRKFNGLTSASYWQTLIKLSESASNHSVSLGFFKLALEFGCEPLQLLRDELKSYVRHHNLAEFGDFVKELCEGYKILENLEQLQVSETCSHVPEEDTRSSDDDVRSPSSVTDAQKLELKPSNTTAAAEACQVKDAKETTQKNESVTKVRRSAKKGAPNSKSGVKSMVGKTQRKPQKPRKQESDKDKVKNQGKKSAANLEGSVNSETEEKPLQANKENMDAEQTEEMILSEV